MKYFLYCPNIKTINLINRAYWVIGHEDPYIIVYKLIKDINKNNEIDIREISNYLQFRISNTDLSS